MSTKHGLAHRFYTGQLSYDFVGKRKFWYAVSAVILALCLLGILGRGINLGIEFRGGTDFQVPMTVTSDTVDEVRAQIDTFEVRDLGAQVFSLGEEAVRIQTRSLNPDETVVVRAAIAQVAGVTAEDVTYTAIGASWGQQVSQQALIALAVFIALVMVLIGFWFRNWKMSLAAVIALAHDLVVTVGIYALVGFSVTPATVIGILTILGYSLYDTVVVFDRVTENTRHLRESKFTYGEAANLAVNQVLIRSLNTTVIGVLPVTALLIGGSMLHSGPLQDLGLALFVGMIAGVYSSIFIATPLLVQMKEREPEQIAHRANLKRKAEKAKARAEYRAEQEASDGEADELESAGSSRREDRRSKLSRAQRKRKRA
ncbi:MAG: protein translocase subunit SecF [Propionibacteriaceae bacterium]|nr:protein translocase subunit SecF [Propionibacteriaceae bacterium]